MAATDSYAGGDGRLSPLSTPSATRAVLEAHGIGTKYTLGQNFLVNDDVLKKIIVLAEVGEADRILEVGPGIGTLTIALLKHAASVVAIERDPDLPAVLADTLHPWRDKFALIEKDALDVTGDDIVAAMAGIGADTGCLDRASSAANETAQWAVSPSEDCLSESEYPVVPTGGEPQSESRYPVAPLLGDYLPECLILEVHVHKVHVQHSRNLNEPARNLVRGAGGGSLDGDDDLVPAHLVHLHPLHGRKRPRHLVHRFRPRLHHQ